MKTILRNFISVLRRYKMAAFLNVLGLSVAFAAFMVIMMQVEYDRSFDRSDPNADCIYRVEISLSEYGRVTVFSRPLADAFIASSPHILGGALGGFFGQELFFSVDSDGNRKHYKEQALTVTAGLTDVFTFDMLEGSDRALQEPSMALIPQSLARKLFGSEPAVGKQLLEEDQSLSVVGGVYKDFPANSTLRNVIYYQMPAEENLHDWSSHNYAVYIRLDRAENAEGLIENFRNNFDFTAASEDAPDLKNAGFHLTPLPELHYITGVQFDPTPKTSRRTMLILFVIAMVIILIAAINFTNFSAALTPKRIKSINTQKVFGGDERVIRASLVVEAAGMCLFAWVVAVGLVHTMQFTPVASLVDAVVSPGAHPLIVAGAALLALLTGALAGLYPAFYMTSFPPALVLKGSFGLSAKGRQLRSVLISVQFIASFALIICASFMYLQNHFMQHTDLGYDRDALIVADINTKVNAGREAFVNQLKNSPEIAEAAYSNTLIGNNDNLYQHWGRKYGDKHITFQCLCVDPAFLRVMGLEVTEGRDFRPGDANSGNEVYIFNRKAREDYEMTLDAKLQFDGEIVGFIPDLKIASMRMAIEPMAFLVQPEKWNAAFNYVYIRVSAGSDLHAAMTHVRSTLQSFDDSYPFDVRFFDEVLNSLYEKEQKLGSLITLFSLITILISIVGVFGLVVFDSEYRRKEISIRKVFGSTTGEILLIFNKSYVRILCICFVLAAPVAWYAVTLWLESFAYRTPMYWWVYLAAFAVVFILTVSTVTFQNWRAANVNPVEAMKES
jgi:putative ABC transport system permease protein